MVAFKQGSQQAFTGKRRLLCGEGKKLFGTVADLMFAALHRGRENHGNTLHKESEPKLAGTFGSGRTERRHHKTVLRERRSGQSDCVPHRRFGGTVSIIFIKTDAHFRSVALAYWRERNG